MSDNVICCIFYVTVCIVDVPFLAYAGQILMRSMHIHWSFLFCILHMWQWIYLFILLY